MDPGKIKSHFERDEEVDRFKTQSSFHDREDYTEFSRHRVIDSVLDGIEYETILDLGCGSGGYLPVVKNKHCTYYGCDFSTKMIVEAAERADDLGISDRTSFVNGDATQIPLDDDSFDVVLAVGLIEYFKNPSLVLREVARVLKPDGTFILHQYTPWPYVSKLWPLIRPVKNIVTGDKIKHHRRSKTQIDALVKQSGFELTDWTCTDFHVLPLPLNLLLFPLHVKISEIVSQRGAKRFRYFAVNYIGRYAPSKGGSEITS